MGWETRKRGGRYYTRSKKINGRVVREYVGGGELAAAIALLDAEERADRSAERAAWRERERKLDEAEEVLQNLSDTIEAYARAVLYAAGYHRHKNGEWRRRREWQ
jgi:hypothetical protein